MKVRKEDILNELKDEIHNIKLEPGSALSEAMLTERYGLSRTPVRDILKQLERDQYIIISPQRATRVSYIDQKSVEEVIYLRTAIEKEVLKDLCNNLTEKNILDLKEIITRQEQFIPENSNFPDFLKVDDDFHKELYRILDKLYLWDIIESKSVHYIRYRRLHILSNKKRSALIDQHISILNSLITGDRLKTEELLENHLKQDYCSDDFLDSFPAYFK